MRSRYSVRSIGIIERSAAACDRRRIVAGSLRAHALSRSTTSRWRSTSCWRASDCRSAFMFHGMKAGRAPVSDITRTVRPLVWTDTAQRRMPDSLTTSGTTRTFGSSVSLIICVVVSAASAGFTGSNPMQLARTPDACVIRRGSLRSSMPNVSRKYRRIVWARCSARARPTCVESTYTTRLQLVRDERNRDPTMLWMLYCQCVGASVTDNVGLHVGTSAGDSFT